MYIKQILYVDNFLTRIEVSETKFTMVTYSFHRVSIGIKFIYIKEYKNILDKR